MSPSSTMLGPLDLAVPGEGEIVSSVRGMDEGVAKLLPEISNVKQSNYRMSRCNMQNCGKACKSRGQAALMMLNSLEGDNWTAMEDTPLDRCDTMNAFSVCVMKFLIAITS